MIKELPVPIAPASGVVVEVNGLLTNALLSGDLGYWARSSNVKEEKLKPVLLRPISRVTRRFKTASSRSSAAVETDLLIPREM